MVLGGSSAAPLPSVQCGVRINSYARAAPTPISSPQTSRILPSAGALGLVAGFIGPAGGLDPSAAALRRSTEGRRGGNHPRCDIISS